MTECDNFFDPLEHEDATARRLPGRRVHRSDGAAPAGRGAAGPSLGGWHVSDCASGDAVGRRRGVAGLSRTARRAGLPAPAGPLRGAGNGRPAAAVPPVTARPAAADRPEKPSEEVAPAAK